MKNIQRIKKQARKRRRLRIRAKIKGTKECPRLFVYRSLKHIYAQLVDDIKGNTLAAANDLEFKKSKIKSKTEKDAEKLSAKIKVAYQVGQLIAKRALEKKIEKVVFDRGGYKYHGRVKALAEGARTGGLRF